MAFRELAQSRWLIVGMGAIGREIAVRAKGFGAHVTGINRTGRADPAADAARTLRDLPALLPTADIVVLSAARTAATTDLVDAKFVAAMKPGSILINIARGELVVDEALLAGERAQTVRAAMARLPKRWQRLLDMLMADPPVPYAQISNELGLPVGSIGPTRGRVLARLRLLLDAS